MLQVADQFADQPDHEPEEAPLRSVSIAVRVLDCFASTPELGATQVARELGVAKSTACRMLAALAAGGLLERGAGGRYRLGLKLYEYGQIALDRMALRELALPVLSELRDTLRETVQLGIPFGSDVLYVDRLEVAEQGSRFRKEYFRRPPAHSSSSGKAMAAFNAPLAKAILTRGLQRWTPFTIVDLDRYRQVLYQVRKQGWASSREEVALGYSSIAAPILVQRAGTKVAVAAISVVGPTHSILGVRKEMMVASVRRGAARVSSDMTTALD